MKIRLSFILLLVTYCLSAQPLKDRIKVNDPSKYRELSAVHAGAGKMGFTQLIGRNDLTTNFLYLHTGVIEAKSGIGQHFHHNIEEMYLILNGEAEFTINGHTSKIKAPAVVPCKMGDAHAIYNASNEKLRWLNFAVSLQKGKADNFDLNNTMVGAKLDPIPNFVSAKLEKEKQKANPIYPGKDVLYRRLITPEVFSTNWDHVDHVTIPAGASSGDHVLTGYEEVYYVIGGNGTVTINGEKVDIKADDAFYGTLGETVVINNTGSKDLELVTVGIAVSKQNMLQIAKPLIQPKAVLLQMDFTVPKENAAAFEKMYYSIYVPAMTVQKGYLSSKVLRYFPDNLAKEIQAEPSDYNYQVQISFATETDRRNWVASPQHQIAWPAASGLATAFKWRGYDVMGDDDQH